MPRSDEQIKMYLADMEDRYNRLVWFAMYDAGLITPSPAGKRRARRVKKELAKEAARLGGPLCETEHAFHCGCLAMARLANGLLAGSDCAPYEFPSTQPWFAPEVDQSA